MKTFITRKTSLIATTGIAAIGMAGLWAQDEPGRDAENDRRNERTKTDRAQDEAQYQEFSGKLVSLTAYFGKEHGSSADKAREDRTGETGSVDSARTDTSAAKKPMGMESQPLGLLMSASTGQAGQADTARAGERDSAGASAHGQQLCILLFDADKQQLAAKAHALCQAGDAKSAGNHPAATAGDDDAKDSVGGDEARETKSASGTKDMHAFKVSVTGKKVMRDGLTAIFVEDIEAADLSALNR